jgi:hypothetical protein
MPSQVTTALRVKLGVAAALWLVAVVTGLWILWAFDNAPGVSASAPARWPADSPLSRAAGRPTIVLLAHPQCSCTRATLGELAEALARARTRPKTYILFLKPEGSSNGWERTDAANPLNAHETREQAIGSIFRGPLTWPLPMA